MLSSCPAVVVFLLKTVERMMVLSHVLAVNSDPPATVLMVTFPVVTESRVVSEPSRPVLLKTCMSIMTRPVKPSHMEECLPAVFGIRGGLSCSLVTMVPLGVDSRETDDTVPDDFLVPPGIPEERLVQA